MFKQSVIYILAASIHAHYKSNKQLFGSYQPYQQLSVVQEQK